MGREMRCYRVATLFALYACVVALPSGNSQDAPAHYEINQGGTVEAGSMSSQSYHSDYFEFTFSLPGGFVEGTDSYRRGILRLPGVYPNANTFILLHGDVRSAQSPDPTAAVTIMADGLSQYPKGATENDYLHHLVSRPLKNEGNEVLKEGLQVDISGKKFFRADYKTNSGPIKGYETVMLTFQRGFALSWTFVAQSKAGLDAMLLSMERTLVEK